MDSRSYLLKTLPGLGVKFRPARGMLALLSGGMLTERQISTLAVAIRRHGAAVADGESARRLESAFRAVRQAASIEQLAAESDKAQAEALTNLI